MTGLLWCVQLICVIVAAFDLACDSLSLRVVLTASNAWAMAQIGLEPRSIAAWLFAGIIIGLDIAAVVFAIVQREDRPRDAPEA